MNFLRYNGSLQKGAKTVALNGQEFIVPEQYEEAYGDLVFGVRPEHISFTDDSAYRGLVLAAEYLGTTQIITLDTPNGNVKARIDASQPVTVGEKVGLAFNPATIILFDEKSGGAIGSELNSGVLGNG
ncbi:MAG: hypothetical protein COB93_08575 [Sneathiella sp.]|nr:MAG: hypothetical protein COB93_08575 [Sneathiella sp.]